MLCPRPKLGTRHCTSVYEIRRPAPQFFVPLALTATEAHPSVHRVPVRKGMLQLNGRMKISGGQFAAPACPHSFLEAMRAPSASERNFIQQKAGYTGPKPANVPKPQSVPAMTRSRPTMLA